jgi:hypothetical protein
MRSGIVASAAIAAVLALSSPDRAAAASPDSGSDGWTGSVTPYLWMAGLSGDVAQFGAPQVHVSADFGDILKNLDFAMMITGVARHDRLNIFGDFMYVKVSTGNGTPRGIIADRVNLKSETFAGMVGAGYALVQDGETTVDLDGALRVWNASTDISLRGGALDGVKVSDSDTWTDALIGLRVQHAANENWSLAGWAFVGAGQADLDWDAGATVSYRLGETFSVAAGYRAAGVNYKNGSFKFDIVEQGPIIGLTMRF